MNNLDNIKAVAIGLLHQPIVETEFWPIICQHPFTNTGYCYVPDCNELHQVKNIDDPYIYEQWTAYIADKIMKAQDIYELYMMINKPYRLTFLKYIRLYIDIPIFSELLRESWISMENPNTDPNFNNSTLIQCFKYCDLQYLMDENDYIFFKNMPDEITVYRGITDQNKYSVRALSWTINPDVAEWFAKRFNSKGIIYHTTIPKKYILAYFSDRNEEEVIIDINKIKNKDIVIYKQL